MSEQPSGPVELGAPMDYSEHEKTYGMFIAGAKYGSMTIVALLIAMAAGFFGHFGFFPAVILYVILNIVGYVLLR
jgi:Bacterial aa3 type cytochrome c oxidase subunit IV